MSKFDKKSLSLRLQRRPTSSVRSRHNDNERQTLSNLILEIWTIFNLSRKQVMTLTPDVDAVITLVNHSSILPPKGRLFNMNINH